MNTQLNRRDFLGTAAAGLTFALTLSRRAASRPAKSRGLSPNLWLTIGADDTITIVSPAAELGQGSCDLAAADPRRRARRRLVQGEACPAAGLGSEEVRQSGVRRRDVDHVELRGARLFQADARRRRAGAPRPDRRRRGEMGRAGRASSRPSRASWCTRRAAGGCATARSPPSPRCRPSCRRSPTATSSPSASFRLIGKDVAACDVPAKATGAAKYAMDVQVPGMVYAAVLQSPYQGGAAGHGR